MRIVLLFLSIFISLLLMSCSGTNPVISDESSLPNVDLQLDGIAVSQTGPDTFRGIMGVYQIAIDRDTLTGEVIPYRQSSAIGDVFDSHITEFMVFNPCINCMRISSIGLITNSVLALDLQVRHPFKDILKRPDLHVFDVRGIVLTPGGIAFNNIVSDIDGDGNPTEIIQTNPNFLINADGYTTHFDDAQLGNYFQPLLNYPGNLNPFKNFFVDPLMTTFDPFQPRGHNVMPVNSEWDTQQYQFYLPIGDDMIATIIIDASYGQSATKKTRSSPTYFLPEFNRKEAREVKVEIYDDTLEEGQPSSSAYVRIFVKDWQAQRSRDPNYPDTNNLLGLKEKSDVVQVEFSCPSFGFFQVKSRLQAEPGGNGSEIAPYEFLFGPLTLGTLTAGDYFGLIAVRDDLAGKGGPYPITTPPGATFPHTGPDITDYTAYQVVKFTVRSVGTVGCPSYVVPFSACTYTVALGATQNFNDTVVGVGTSPANILDIDYGLRYPLEDVFAMEQGGILGAGIDSGSGGFWPFRTGEPGFRVSSIDVDSQNRLVFSGSGLSYAPGPVSVSERNNAATDKFHVWLLTTFPATPIVTVDIDPVGSSRKVIAIDTDWNDDVWLIDSENYVHKYLVGENYNEDLSSGFDLDLSVLPPVSFRGRVFDFVINLNNKSMYILTDYHTNGTLYRIECDGTYYLSYSGNQNPAPNVLPGPHNGLADIMIDNHLRPDGTILTGAQDCQMVVIGGRFDGIGTDWQSSLFITRINSLLSNPRYSIRDYGAQCGAIDPVNNMIRIVHGGPDGNYHFTILQPPTSWL